ncbi:MAG: hypothetical protein CSA36_04750 [Draconibacterium sp.]|nr:MAG: hypothetical protein CSA36_04750 [Draconibacterium sp.]
MKIMKNLKVVIASFLLTFPYILVAQDEGGSYIDSLNVQDSSYLNQSEVAAGAEKATASSQSTIIIAIIIVVVLAAALIILLRKRKK